MDGEGENHWYLRFRKSDHVKYKSFPGLTFTFVLLFFIPYYIFSFAHLYCNDNCDVMKMTSWPFKNTDMIIFVSLFSQYK